VPSGQRRRSRNGQLQRRHAFWPRANTVPGFDDSGRRSKGWGRQRAHGWRSGGCAQGSGPVGQALDQFEAPAAQRPLPLRLGAASRPGFNGQVGAPVGGGQPFSSTAS